MTNPGIQSKQRRLPVKRALGARLVGSPFDPDDKPVGVEEAKQLEVQPEPPKKKRGRPSTGKAKTSTERMQKKRLNEKVEAVLEENKDDNGRLPNERSGEGERKFGMSEIERIIAARELAENGSRRVSPRGHGPVRFEQDKTADPADSQKTPFNPASPAEWKKLHNHYNRVYHIVDWAFYEEGYEGDPLMCRLCRLEVESDEDAYNHVSQTLDLLRKRGEHWATLKQLDAPENLVEEAWKIYARDPHNPFFKHKYRENPGIIVTS